MKPRELTLACVPHLNAVLSAVERTQIDFYGIDRNFLEIEETLTTFLEKLKQVKEQHGGLHKCNGSERTDHQPDGN